MTETAFSRTPEYRKQYRASRDPEVFKDYQLRVKFGITLEQYKEMREKQAGLCALCHQPERIANRDLAVDHCHRTNKVRGLLCSNCNRAVGLLGDDWRVMLRAAWYLFRHRKST